MLGHKLSAFHLIMQPAKLPSTGVIPEAPRFHQRARNRATVLSFKHYGFAGS